MDETKKEGQDNTQEYQKQSEDVKVQNNEGDNTEDKKDSSTSGEENNIDYKAELEKTQRELEQAKFTLAKKNIDSKKEKEQHKEEEEEEDSEEEDKDPRTLVREEIENFKLEQSNSIIVEELNKLSNNDDEKRLIDFIFKNKIVRSGYDRASIISDLESAKLLANKSKIAKLGKEIKASNDSKNATSGGSGSGSGTFKSDSDSDFQLSEEDKKLMKVFGVSEKDIKSN